MSGNAGEVQWPSCVAARAAAGPASIACSVSSRHAPGIHARPAAHRGPQDRIDTVLLALTDMQGRLQGKRLTARPFPRRGRRARRRGLQLPARRRRRDEHRRRLRDVARGSAATATSRWSRTSTRCGRSPWHEKTALCLADLRWADGEPVVASPRQILRAQLDRLAERGLEAFAGTELEFIVFKDTYEEAFEKGYRGLKPANQYNVDYSLLGTARVEPLIGRIRNQMAAAGLVVESSKGECNDGQHEINFHYGPALRTADEHAIYKTGGEGDRRAGGAGDHVHGQVRRARGLVVPHPHVACDGPATTPGLRALRRRPARLPARADAVLRAEHQLLQALRDRLVRADRGRLGPRQPHVRGARRRPRRLARLELRAAGRRRQPVPGAGGDDRGRAARARRRAGARAAAARATPTSPTSRTCRRR